MLLTSKYGCDHLFYIHEWMWNCEMFVMKFLFFLSLWHLGKRGNCNLQKLCLWKIRGHSLKHFLCPEEVVTVEAFCNCISKRMGCLKDTRNRWLWEFSLYTQTSQRHAIALATISLILHLGISTFSAGDLLLSKLFILMFWWQLGSFPKLLSFTGNC